MLPAKPLWFCFTLGLLTGTPAFAESRPALGAYGFNWLKPETAQCRPLTEALNRKLPACLYHKEGSFGLSDPFFACRPNKQNEYLFYQSLAECTRNLETMQANAP